MSGLAEKADYTHIHAQSDITGLTDALADALAGLATNTSMTSAIDALRQEMLGDTPSEAYNTFTELAKYIADHKEVSDALTTAIGNKADKATTISGYGMTGTEAIWEEICESHDGTKYDPIPYSGNMALEAGKYYSQDGVTYKCTRDTGNPVYSTLAELVGVYVEIVT